MSLFTLYSVLSIPYTLLLHLLSLLSPPRVTPPPPPSAPNGRVALVTGANTGIGLQTALALSERGLTVVLACRDPAKGQAAAALVPRAAFVAPLDLASFASVRAFAKAYRERFKRLDVLVNNAGVNSFEARPPTADGFEHVMQVNFLAAFLLTDLLLPCLKEGVDARVVNVSSVMHRFATPHETVPAWSKAFLASSPTSHYSDSKLAAVLFSLELNRRRPSLRSFAVNPGAVNSDIWRSLPASHPLLYKHLIAPAFRLLYLTPAQGCATSLAAAILELDPSRSLYLQPYLFPRKPAYANPHSGLRLYPPASPLWEIMGVFVGHAAAVPSLPGGDGKGAARALWKAAAEATGAGKGVS
ncbi:hypothetical protein TeGR_g6122 [Tetraparma gracilis]|uniref:NAD(P)-binding protein n=1 Tax=Tetraparma gracilis TaxID=2962635 RepID=A0ABQ6N500_9STRA|nr:hypothetical protein TeGR_g6122 [Tetraparma gracilis]